MTSKAACTLALFLLAGLAFLPGQPAGPVPAALEPAFEQHVKPFLQKNCAACHNADLMTSGVRVDHLDASLQDRQLKLWEAIRKKIADGSMPPKGLPRPAAADRDRMLDWISSALDFARLRPQPRNGLVRRLTVAQYRNTLRELLLLDDDFTEALPPDAISRDGFVNNQETLQLSPLLLEAYFEIAEEALKRAIVDPKSKPRIQNFRVGLGVSVNPAPLAEQLILGANSLLLDNKDFVVTQPVPTKPFPFEPFRMRTKFRFIEGYQGNDTVRGWREYDSIYHAVFACMRGTGGYPKGLAYSTVPQGLLLRPAIPNDGIFGTDGTYGPKANFKISLRELPDHGRFRVTVTAAKYDDGLLVDDGTPPQAPNGVGIAVKPDAKSVTLSKAGIYQVDVYPAERAIPPAPDASRLAEGLAGSWPLDGDAAGVRLEGKAHFVDSPFGKAVSLDGEGDSVSIARGGALNGGEGEFTVAAWINPKQLRRGGIVSFGAPGKAQGWYLQMPDNRGTLRLETIGPDHGANGAVATQRGAILPEAWQHVAAVVRRGKDQTRLYINGYPAAKGEIGPASLDNPQAMLYLGRLPGAQQFHGDLDEVRLYRRALDEAEIQALVEPGRKFAQAPPENTRQVTLTLGERQFSGTLKQPAFVVLRLPASSLRLDAETTGMTGLSRIVLTPLDPEHELSRRFLTFEKRVPKLGVYLGLRRDCGSTLAPAGEPQTVAGTQLARYIFEGAISNFPSPDVEKDNVNYLAGVREIGVHSEYTDGRDMPRLLIRSVEFEGPFYETWPPPSHRRIFGDSAAPDARSLIRRFATRAYRRPITPAEESTLMGVYSKSSAAGRGFRESVRDALQVALTSPQFLFLIEKSASPAAEPLDDYELASKLSYFLWNGPPDRKALELAALGSLGKQLDPEITRMIDDPRFSRFTREFASQWLALEKFQVLEPDRERFPRLTRDTRAQLRQEPIEFLQYLFRANLPLRNLIASDFLLANETVAGYYDLAAKTESGLQFVPVSHGRRELGGVLSQAAIMAGLSDGRESNPVKRGAWLARRIIAEPPDDPPPNVPALKEETRQLTLRQRLEQHRNQPGCHQCHSKIDPWGVALEEFDAGGRWKAQPTDAHSTLPDKTEVSGIDDLRRYLAGDRIDQVAFSFLKHLSTYGAGRSLTYSELQFLKQDATKLRSGGYRMRDLLRYVVNSKMFLEK